METMVITDITPDKALWLVARGLFTPFGVEEWHAFAGCQSSDPRIAEVDDYIIVLDGDLINVIQNGDMHGGQVFQLFDPNK